MITCYAFGMVPPFARGLVRDLRVRWALEEAGLPYRVELVGDRPGETSREAYRKLQPFGQIPAIVDADTGFGSLENAARTIRELEAAGLAGCHIEDQEFPKRCGHLAGKSLVDVEEMKERIKASVAARRDSDFMIIARTDARAVEDFNRTVDRAQRYKEAGADAIFPEALQSAEEFRDFANAIDLPLLANMTEFGKSPLLSFKDLAGFGYRMVIFPQSAFRVSMKATKEFFRALKKNGTQKEWLDEMQTREDLYKLLDYDPTAEKWLG